MHSRFGSTGSTSAPGRGKFTPDFERAATAARTPKARIGCASSHHRSRFPVNQAARGPLHRRTVCAANWPKAIVLAVPVATPEIVQSLGFEVEHCVCLQAPSELYAIGVFYEDFREVSGDDVLRLLDRAWQERASETESVA